MKQHSGTPPPNENETWPIVTLYTHNVSHRRLFEYVFIGNGSICAYPNHMNLVPPNIQGRWQRLYIKSNEVGQAALVLFFSGGSQSFAELTANDLALMYETVTPFASFQIDPVNPGITLLMVLRLLSCIGKIAFERQWSLQVLEDVIKSTVPSASEILHNAAANGGVEVQVVPAILDHFWTHQAHNQAFLQVLMNQTAYFLERSIIIRSGVPNPNRLPEQIVLVQPPQMEEVEIIVQHNSSSGEDE